MLFWFAELRQLVLPGQAVPLLPVLQAVLAEQEDHQEQEAEIYRIKQEIVTGQRPPGARLPGGRDLAVAFSINPNTAARVYRELEGEEICVTKRGLGTFVTEDEARIRALREEMASDAAKRFLD